MAVINQTLIINGTDLATYGVHWERRSGWRSYPNAKVVMHRLAARPGMLFQSREEDVSRLLTVRGVVLAPNMSTLYSRIDEIASRMRGSMTIGFSDDPRTLTGYLEEALIHDVAPGAVEPTARFTYRFRCPDPFRYDVSAQNINASSDLPIGTAPVYPVITITGAATNPTTLELRDHLGAVVSSFTMAAALASGSESWVINSKTGVVTFDDGSIVSALDDFSGTFPVLDPADTIFTSSDWGQIVITAGGSPDLDIVYTRAWM